MPEARRPGQKIGELETIYRHHERAVGLFVREAVCRPGCGYCCTHYGRLDVTTLEGLVIRKRLSGFKGREHSRMLERIRRNRKEKKAGAAAVCPFLDEEKRCRIYDARPFSCRQLYSVKPCGETGPTVHRQAVELARAAVEKIQRLDDTGYSGHLTFILALLDDRRFRTLYTAGGFDPARIAAFGQTHQIVINRRAAPGRTPPEET
jgi:hypothetical protein